MISEFFYLAVKCVDCLAARVVALPIVPLVIILVVVVREHEFLPLEDEEIRTDLQSGQLGAVFAVAYGYQAVVTALKGKFLFGNQRNGFLYSVLYIHKVKDNINQVLEFFSLDSK